MFERELVSSQDYPDVVCIGCAEWDAELWTNQQHLMSRLSARQRVVFVESLGLRRPAVSGRDVRRIARRLLKGARPLRQEAERLWVLSPIVVPLHGKRMIDRFNEMLLRAYMRIATRRARLANPVLWAYVPHAFAVIDTLKPRAVIYHCVDDIAAQKGVDADAFRAVERSFASAADLIFASAPPLAARMREMNPNVYYVPNVADTAHFAQAHEPGPVDQAIAALGRPLAVFIGAIVRTKLDVGLLVATARQRPDWQFALVGPVGLGDPDTDVSALEGVVNVHMLGPRPYQQLPEVLRGADVGLIPYADNDLTRSVFPMKVYEYLAAGLPVVATPLPSLDGVDDIWVARNAAEFSAMLDRAREEGPAERAARTARALEHSWDARIAEMRSAVAGAVKRRSTRQGPS